MMVAIAAEARPVIYDDLRRRPFRRLPERAIIAVLYACAALSLITTLAIVIVLFREAFSFFRVVSPREFCL